MSSNAAASSMALAPIHVTPIFLVFTLLALAFLLYRNKATATTMKIELHHRLPPGPSGGMPIIGSMHRMIWNKPVVFRWIHHLLKEMDTNIMCLRFGAVHVIVVSCPEIAREVLRKNDAVLASRPVTFASGSFSFGYKGSILSPYGEQWKKMKRVLTSEVLSASMERRFHGRRAEEADHLVRFVYNRCNATASRSVVDVRHVTRHFCGNMIRRLVFSKRHFAEPPPPASAGAGPGPDEVDHVDALFTLLNYLYSFCVSDYFPVVVGLDLDGHEKVVHDVMVTLNRLHDPIIEERIHEWFALRERGKKREIRDFLDVLVSLEDSQGRPLLSLEEIKAQTAVSLHIPIFFHCFRLKNFRIVLSHFF
jgi:phenylalanine N-monooxygenase